MSDRGIVAEGLRRFDELRISNVNSTQRTSNKGILTIRDLINAHGRKTCYTL